MDGVHFLEEPVVTLKVNNEAIRDETDFTECNKDNLKTITVRYIDKNTGKDIAASETHQGYEISMYDQFQIKAKDIAGYRLVSGPDMSQYNGYYYKDKPKDSFVFEYESTGEGENPGEPGTPGEGEDPGKPEDPKNPENPLNPEPGEGANGKANQTKNSGKGAAKTGDKASVFPVAAISLAAGMTAVVILKKKREQELESLD